jgi:branched-chain amino acid transport system permease protein
MQRLTLPVLLLLLFGGLIFAAYTEMINLYIQSVIMFMGINIIMSTSLNLINGNMGEFSCGHAGPMAVGAYVSSILSVLFFARDRVFGDPLLTPELSLIGFPIILLIGGLAASLVGFIVALPSFKTRGDYLAIITIAASYIIKSTIENIPAIGGARGFMGMKRVTNAMEDAIPALVERVGGWFIDDPKALEDIVYAVEDVTMMVPWMLIWIFIFTVFTIWIIRRFIFSTFGKGVNAICQDEIAAEIMSVNTNKMKIVAFMLSSGLAGIAGGLFAHVLGYVNPGSFTLLKSTEAMVMVYLGGMGSLSGAVISAVLFTILLEGLRFVIPWIDQALHYIHLLPDGYEVTQVWKWVMIPLLLVLIMQFRPEGLMGNRELGDFFPRLRKLVHFK